MCKICVFAGTSEGRRLLCALQGRGAELTACVATEYGRETLEGLDGVRVLSGRMDEGEMEAFLRREGFDAVVDATHPYAAQATENLRSACESAGEKYLRLGRESQAGEDDGVFVPDAAACAEYLANTEGNILLTTGSKDLPTYCQWDALRARVYARVLPMASSLDICAKCGVAPDHIIAMQGPFSEEMNAATLKMVHAQYMVTKDTGAAGGYEDKIAAARKAGCKTVIIGRPPQSDGLGMEETIGRLEAMLPLTPGKKRVCLAGIGMGGEDTRTLGLLRAVAGADCLIGARRMLEAVTAPGKPKITAIAASEIGRVIRESREYRRFTVLLSGDTGFYSGARALVEELRDMEVEVLPGVGSLSFFCARLKRPWEDVRAVSLHGRECDLVREVKNHPAVFTLTGGKTGVKDALERLIRAGLGGLTAHVGERLGYPDERITTGSAEGLSGGEYDPLSVLLIENPGAGLEPVTYGLPDEAFDRDETPMTKSEVRSVSLSKLELTRQAVVYDVGSGSGSVSVEAARIAWQGHVYAVEMKEKAAALTRKNGERFGLSNLTVVEGRAPEILEDLPAPTHAFIGGSGGSMALIIDCLLKKNPSVRIVVNTVTLESLTEMTEISRRFQIRDIAEVSVTKPREVGRYRLMTAHNPVYIFTLQYRNDDSAND